MSAYKHMFKEWKDVALEFCGIGDWRSDGEKAEALAKIPEPDKVFIAAYDIDGYEGDAWVVYRNGGKYYQNYGCHCSCFGLEDQWEPEEYETAALLIACLEKGEGYGQKRVFKDEAIAALKADK